MGGSLLTSAKYKRMVVKVNKIIAGTITFGMNVRDSTENAKQEYESTRKGWVEVEMGDFCSNQRAGMDEKISDGRMFNPSSPLAPLMMVPRKRTPLQRSRRFASHTPRQEL